MNGTRLCSVSGSYSTYFILSYSLLSQNVENNSSTIRLYGTFQYGGGTSVGSSYSTFKVDGTTVKSGSYRYYPGDTQLGYKDITVTHNADGSWPGRKVTIEADSYHMSGTASATITGIASIPRSSNLTLSPSTVEMGSNLTIRISRAVSTYTDTITYKFGSRTGTIATKTSSSTLTWTVPRDLAYEIPNAMTGTGTITCTTYNGSTKIGSKSFSFMASVGSYAMPTYTKLQIDYVSDDVPASWDMLVAGKSKVRLTVVGAQGNYGASIKSYNLSGAGAFSDTNEFETDFFPQGGSYQFKVIVTDSRGWQNYSEFSLDVEEYFNPGIENSTVYRCDSSGSASEEGTYVYISGTLTYASLNNRHGASATIQYRKVGEEYWSTAETLRPGNPHCGGNLDVDNSYELLLTITDSIGTESQFTTQLPTSYSTLEFRKGGKGIAIGKASEKDGFEVAMPTWFTDSVEVPDVPKYSYDQKSANTKFVYDAIGAYDDAFEYYSCSDDSLLSNPDAIFATKRNHVVTLTIYYGVFKAAHTDASWLTLDTLPQKFRPQMSITGAVMFNDTTASSFALLTNGQLQVRTGSKVTAGSVIRMVTTYVTYY